MRITTNGYIFLLDDQGLSIFYFQEDQQVLSSALSREKLLQLLLSTGEFDLVDYFKTLVGLSEYFPQDLQAAEALSTTH